MRLMLLLAIVGTAAAAVTSPGDDLRIRLRCAAPGDALIVEAGDYDGPFIIDKPVRLIGRPGAILRGDKTSHVVAVRAPDVEIAGFIIRGSGRDLGKDQAAIHITAANAFVHDNKIMDCLHGIYVRKADHVRIGKNIILGDGMTVASVADPLSVGLKPGEGELCEVETVQDRRGNGIHLWNSKGHVILDNAISGTRDGIYFSFTDESIVRNNTISHVRYGLHYMYSDNNVFEGNTFTENAAGSALMYSKGLTLRGNQFVANRSHRAYGLLFQSVDNTRVERNTIKGNTLGFYLENSNDVIVSHNRITGNYIALRVSDSTATSCFFENQLHGNIHPLETGGRNTGNAWAFAGRGNAWDGVLDLDLNHDGIADVAHHEPDLFGQWRRSFPAIGLLSASPGERLLRFIHSRLALSSLPGITDPRPLIGGSDTP